MKIEGKIIKVKTGFTTGLNVKKKPQQKNPNPESETFSW